MIERKLRILMVVPEPFFTECGSHVRIYEEARSLGRLGHRVRIVTLPSGQDMPGFSLQRISALPGCGKLPPGPSWRRFLLDFRLYRRALAECRAFRPHLIHAHLHEGAWIGGRLRKALGIPLLFDCHGSLTGAMVENGFARDGSRRHRFFSNLERRINAGPSDFIVTRSGEAARDLVQRWGAPAAKVGVLRDAVDTAHFRPHPREEARGKLRIPPHIPIAVYLGGMGRSHGIDLLLSCIVQLKSKGSPLRFMIMGYPEEAYRARAAELGVEKMLTFTGRIEYARAPFYLSAGDLAVSPRLPLNGSNGALAAYQACGLPAVCFDDPVNREMLGEAGVYAEYGDISDLAARIAWLTAHEDERKDLGRMALEHAARCNSWDLRAAELDGIYQSRLKR